jgi:hypothetical protein
VNFVKHQKLRREGAEKKEKKKRKKRRGKSERKPTEAIKKEDMIQKGEEWELAKRWFCLDKARTFDWESRARGQQPQQKANKIGLPVRYECCGGAKRKKTIGFEKQGKNEDKIREPIENHSHHESGNLPSSILFSLSDLIEVSLNCFILLFFASLSSVFMSLSRISFRFF